MRVRAVGICRIAMILLVVVTDLGAALPVARPVLAGVVLPVREPGSIQVRPCQDVVPVWVVSAAVDHLAVFVQLRRLRETDVRVVKLVEIAGNTHALGIEPGA